MSVPAAAVYILAFLTSALCSGLLIRSYIGHRTRLLLWCAVCFIMLALNNFFLVVDLVMLPEVDLSYLRSGLALMAVATLLYGFIWEVD